jgi:hypothetical protein
MMKHTKFALLFLMAFMVILGCSKKEDNDDPTPTPTSQVWDFAVTFNVTDPDVYSFDGAGVAAITINGSAFTIIATYTIGMQTFQDVTITGTVGANNELIFDNKPLILEWDMGGVHYTETVNFNIDPYTISGNTASGTGTITMLVEPGGVLESGNLVFTATRQV